MERIVQYRRWQSASLATLAACLITILGWGTTPGFALVPANVTQSPLPFVLRSPAFAPRQEIPARYTCDGNDLSPPLQWAGLPPGTKSLVLIVDDPDAPDPDAPRMVWVHWILYNIPASMQGLPEAAGNHRLPPGIRGGLNDWKRTRYGGPCPPVGRHRYLFKLYALDTLLPDLHAPSKTVLLNAMNGHVLGKAMLIGTYQRQHR